MTKVAPRALRTIHLVVVKLMTFVKGLGEDSGGGIVGTDGLDLGPCLSNQHNSTQLCLHLSLRARCRSLENFSKS